MFTHRGLGRAPLEGHAPGEAPPTRLGRQGDLAAVEPLGEGEQGAARAAAADQEQGLLAVEGALGGVVVEGDDGGGGQLQSPLDLGAAVVVAAVVAVEDHGQALAGHAQGLGQVG